METVWNFLRFSKRGMLPTKVKQSSEVYGHTNPIFFASKIPYAEIAGDQTGKHFFGQMCYQNQGEWFKKKHLWLLVVFMLIEHRGKKPIVSEKQKTFCLTTVLAMGTFLMGKTPNICPWKGQIFF